MIQRFAGNGFIERLIVAGKRRCIGNCSAEQLATPCQSIVAAAIGQQSELANALKGARQYVQQDATYELVGLESHRRLWIIVSVVSSFEGTVDIIQSR